MFLKQGGDPEQLNAAVVEIKRLNESMSQLRQENLLLKVSPVAGSLVAET
jgi:hypothetical protein